MVSNSGEFAIIKTGRIPPVNNAENSMRLKGEYMAKKDDKNEVSNQVIKNSYLEVVNIIILLEKGHIAK